MANKTQQTKLLDEIYNTSFAVNELTLYLDTHPEDSAALQQFHELKARRRAALETFEQKHYPLTVDCITDAGGGWTWGDAPPPWQGGSTNVEL